MAIDRIPGVGPQNSDIAATIATTPAVSAQITANVPTASAIATAVAAPSIGQITTAITTNAASAGVTMAAITSTVQANAGSPFGGTWTFLSSQNPAASTITFSGLSGYRRYRLYFMAFRTGAYSLDCRINNLTGNNYAFWTTSRRNNSTTAFNISSAADTNGMFLTPESVFENFPCHGYIDFDQANSGQYKTINWYGSYLTNSGQWRTSTEGIGWVRTTAAIDRIDIAANAPLTPIGTSGFWLFGGN
jgi:hypothetical protein